MSKHTPGPWEIEECETGAMIHRRSNWRYRYVADVHAHTYDPDNSQAMADARVIAESPAMLEMLETLIAKTDDSYDYTDTGASAWVDLSMYVDEMKDIVRRAKEGKS